MPDSTEARDEHPASDPTVIATRQEFARGLTELRERAGLTVRAVANQAGIRGRHATIGGWFSGQALPSPSLRDLLEQVLRVCGVTEEEPLRQWLEAWRRVRRAATQPATGPEPYRGLDSFQPEDAAWFFGRERLTTQLTDRLADMGAAGGGVQLVVGPSGSGKSSLLRAGLIPALRAGRVPGSADWPILLMTPGRRPVEELAVRLAEFADAPTGAAVTDLRTDPTRSARYAREAAAAATTDARLVVVVDQFEELFTALNIVDQRLFVTALFAAASTLGGAIVALGMRADFYAEALQHPQLVAAASGQVTVGSMTETELRSCIVEPARLANLQPEPGLVDLLLREVAPAPGSVDAHEAGKLPLLSHALYATWRRGRGRQLTASDYLAVGGIGGSVAEAADRVYDGLPGSARELARRLFLSLVHVASDTGDTRRRVTLAELRDEYGAEASEMEEVLDQFIGQRLITAHADAVQISHEALLGAWPKLRVWLDRDHAGLVIGRQLTNAANTWQREQHPPHLLYGGTQLVAARSWAIEHRYEVSSFTGRFLRASDRYARRRSRRLMTLIATLTVLVLAAGVLAGYAFQQRADANAARRGAVGQRNQAISRLVAGRADKLRGSDIPLAMQLSLAAYRISPTVEARSSLLNSYATPGVTRLGGFTAPVQSVAFSGGRHLLAAGGVDGTVRLWDVSRPGPPSLLGRPLTGPVRGAFTVVFSPDADTVAAAGTNGGIYRWDIRDPRHPVSVGPPLTGPTSTIYSVAFSPDGRTVAAGSADRTVRLWRVSTGRPEETLTGPSDAVQSVAFSPDGRTLAAGSADGSVRLWEVPAAGRPHPTGPPFVDRRLKVLDVVFSPDGHTLAAAGADKTVQLWDVTDPRHPRLSRPPLTGPTSWVNAIAFSPDGTTLAGGSSDNTVTEWSTATGRILSRLPHPAPVTAVAYEADGHTLATGSTDAVVRVWQLPGPVLAGATDATFAVAFNPRGTTLAVVGRDRTVRLWDVRRPRQPVESGHPITSPPHHSEFVGTAAFSPDGRLLAVGTRAGPVELWNVQRPTRPVLQETLTGPTKLLESLTFSPDGRTLAGGGDDTTVRLWSLAGTGRSAASAGTIRIRALISSVAFSPDSRMLAVATADDTARLWDVTNTGHPLQLCRPLAGFSSYVLAVAFSPDGATLAAGSADKTIRFWDVTRPTNPRRLGPPLTGPASNVYWVAFSPDGRSLAATDTGGAVWLWTVTPPAHPEPLAVLTMSAAAYTLGFSPDGRLLAAAGTDPLTRLWDTDPGRVASWVCGTAGDPITRQEWHEYVPTVPYAPPCRR